MNIPDLKEVAIKECRIMDYMSKNDYEAAVIGRRDNFAWLTCGGNNGVVLNYEAGVCIVVITKDAKYIIAKTMDAQRLIDEELQGMNDYYLVSLKWYECSIEEKALELIKGKKAFSDVRLKGVDFKPDVFYDLHYPLTENEIMRYRILGKTTEEIIKKVADRINPGMTEKEVESFLAAEYANNHMQGVVYIIGSDERISKYRHCLPTDKRIDKFVMIATACQKWGITLPITRMIYWGDTLPEDIRRKYEALCIIEAHTFAYCFPGNKFCEILDIQKRLFEETGFTNEWEKHYQGGITGYVVNNPTKCTCQDAVITDKQTFNWYITITGTKVEETILTSLEGKEILSSTGLWPVKKYQANGQTFFLPQILLK